jgi:hypothetical protein
MHKLLIILLLLGVVYFCLFRETTVEGMSCLPDMTISDEQFKILDLEKYKSIVVSIFKDIVDYNADNKSIGKYLFDNKVNEKDIKSVIKFIENQINNYSSELDKNYVINEESALNALRNTFYRDILINVMKCGIDDINIVEDIFKHIINIITEEQFEECSTKKFLEYCESNYSNLQEVEQESDIEETVESFAEIIAQTKQQIASNTLSDTESKTSNTESGNSSGEFSVGSIESTVLTFNEDSFGSEYKKVLGDLIRKFKEKYSRKMDNTDKKDLVKLVELYIPDLEKLIKEIKGGNDKLVPEFILKRTVFYKLKLQYKLLSIYILITTLVKNPEERKNALLCCQKEGKCYNFSNEEKMSNPIVYGFPDYGYVSEVKCLAPGAKSDVKLDSKLEDHLSNKFNNWRQMNESVKKEIYEKLENYLKYFKADIKNLRNLNISEIRKSIPSEGKQNLKFISSKKLQQVTNDISKLLNIDDGSTKEIKDRILKSNTISNINQHLASVGIDNQIFDLNSLNDLETAKFSAIKLVDLNKLFTNFNVPKPLANSSIKNVLGLAQSKDSFRIVLSRGNISNRYHQRVFGKIIEIIKPIKTIRIEDNINLDSIPSEAIKYLTPIFPVGKDDNLCNSWHNSLSQMRRNRAITFEDYLEYKDKIIDFCNNKEVKLEPKIISEIKQLAEIKETQFKDIKEVPLDAKTGLPTVTRDFVDFKTFVSNSQTPVNADIIRASKTSYNSLYSIYGTN